MADNTPKHKHSKDDIIIRDNDGTFKILVDGKFVDLEAAEGEAHAAEHGPKRAHEFKQKKPQVQPPKKPTPPKDLLESKPPVSGLADQELANKAEQVLRDSGVTFSSGDLRARAKNILIAHLKKVRKPFETKDNLMKPHATGGVGLTEKEAETLLNAANGQPIAKPQSMPEKPSQPVVPQPRMPVGGEVVAPSKIMVKDLPPPPPAKIMPTTPPPVTAPKPAVADIKRPPRAAVGPVEELNYALDDWRRLGANPRDRINTIENKLAVLEQEQYRQRLEGIESWHRSEVVQKYLEAGRRSLEEGRGVEEMLGSGGPDQLSFDEWQAIAELDQRLRP